MSSLSNFDTFALDLSKTLVILRIWGNFDTRYMVSEEIYVFDMSIRGKLMCL